MITVFKTNVQTKTQAKQVLRSLQGNLSGSSINFDLQDCDKILRVAAIKKLNTETIIADLNKFGFSCEVLN